MRSEMQAMTKRRIWGQVLVFSAHGGRLFRLGSAFVAWKTASAVASMERTMRLQAKLIPRRKIFAILTRTLTFYFLLALSHSQVVCELTISLACSFSRETSCFSRSRSSLEAHRATSKHSSEGRPEALVGEGIWGLFLPSRRFGRSRSRRLILGVEACSGW